MLVTDSTTASTSVAPNQIIYLINVDWFFVSHFLHVAKRAKQEGAHVTIMTRLERTGTRLRDLGFDVIDLPGERRGQTLSGLATSIKRVRQEITARPLALLHGYGVFAIVVGTLALAGARSRRVVYTITGRGYLAVDPGWRSVIKRSAIRAFVSRLADRGGVQWIAENGSDLEQLGLRRAAEQGRALVVPGAGVDVEKFQALPMPDAPPIKCLLVARAIWSKGIDVAVDAIQRARASGREIELTIAGGIDDANPRAFTHEDMVRFSTQPGVRWLGHVADIAALWRDHHVALLPSRGGEGVPKSLIEAAASARPVITTRVPGCEEFARATGGTAVQPGDAAALAEALLQIDVASLQQSGTRARRAVEMDYSEEAVWRRVCAVYSRHLAAATALSPERR